MAEPEKAGGSDRILVTGGAGYIGSHCVLELLKCGFSVTVVDNLSNAQPALDGSDLPECLRRVTQITGKTPCFIACDLRNAEDVDKVFTSNRFDCVIHLAALKAVGKSCAEPLKYYENNIVGTLNLISAMQRYRTQNIVFSSSATVYGLPEYLPVDEKHRTGLCTNPYGKTKFFIEEILKDLSQAEDGWNIILLRYFNPIGAHESGLIGEDPSSEPNNLAPCISQVAVGKRSILRVYGDDFPTKDGTGIRDYLHVVDLAEGHICAVRKVLSGELCGLRIYNLGTSKGYSVLEVIKTFEAAAGVRVPFEIVPRRPGDVAALYADASLASKELGWNPTRDLRKMCSDIWHWQTKNPHGFHKSQ